MKNIMNSFPFAGIKKPLLMGILNTTPDSFSDGGNFLNVDDAISAGLKLLEAGATILDIGAESTRPGASSISPSEQVSRSISPIFEISQCMTEDKFISIDTRSAEVAGKALQAGACIVNDVSAGSDPEMFPLVARTGASIILMHMNGQPNTMQVNPSYTNVVDEVKNFLLTRVREAISHGISPEKIAIDPGIGFGKSLEHNLLILKRLNVLIETGIPVVIGTSRKKFLGVLCERTVPAELDSATCATTALGVAAGVKIFRVHNVRDNFQAVNTSFALY
jgi:dihydropteroate synthase